MERVADRVYAETDLWSSSALSAHRGKSLQKVARRVALLSELYTRRRMELHGELLQENDLRVAYLFYFLPINLCKCRQILNEIWLNPQARSLFRSSLRVLDLGCGPGSMLLGFLDFLSDLPGFPGQLDIYAVDALEVNLRDARYFVEWWVSQFLAGMKETAGKTEVSHHYFHADMRQCLNLLERKPFHFILIGNVLNELLREEIHRIEGRYQIISKLVEQWLAPDGFLILMEPALKETSRDLLLLRNELIRRNGFNVYAPCVHNFPCPAVSTGNPNDWCHEDRFWESPQIFQHMSRKLSHAGDTLKYSYVVLTRQRISVADSAISSYGGGKNQLPKDFLLWRVVSELMEERGKSCAFLCGSSGREKTTRLNKHRSSSNCAFEELKRGQVIATHRLIESQPRDWRVDPETEVRILMNVR